MKRVLVLSCCLLVLTPAHANNYDAAGPCLVVLGVVGSFVTTLAVGLGCSMDACPQGNNAVPILEFFNNTSLTDAQRCQQQKRRCYGLFFGFGGASVLTGALGALWWWQAHHRPSESHSSTYNYRNYGAIQ